MKPNNPYLKCLICQGGHHYSDCPTLSKAKAYFQVTETLQKDAFQGESPAPFVGRFGYPRVNVGMLAPGEIHQEVWKFDAPRYWATENYSIPQVISRRAALINSRFKMDIKKVDKMVAIAQEVALASKPVDIEFTLEQKPHFRLESHGDAAPTGPSASLKQAKITNNPTISQAVEKVFSDTDLKASEGLQYLYEKGFEENMLSKMLSVGTLGLKKNRKLVPTRWSITATDDTLGKQLIEEIKDFPLMDPTAFFGGYLGNNYLILLFPDVFSYELFEIYLPTGAYGTDHEFYDGRKEYATQTAGGYYAARLAILERLRAMKKQASVLAIRMITDDYHTGLGVWVVRESSRKSVSSQPLPFSDKSLLLDYARKLAKKKFGYDLDPLLRSSKVLHQVQQQKRLFQY